ncbi:MAG: restriction endonuclease subunit S [Thermoguttaceae bacterium]|jgi:type I restriction enzyme S subunit
MKNGWRTKTLEDACQFSNGLWKGEKPPFVNVGVIRNTNFTKEGTLDDSDIAYLDVEAKKLENRRLQFGDIILEKSGGGPKQPVGRVALFDKEDGDFSFSNFTAALRVLDPHELDFRFLHKFLYWTYLSGVTEGMQTHSTGIRNLNGDAYKAIKITFPPLPEQRRIVGILDEAFEGIATAKANAEKNLQNARTIFESHLQSLLLSKKWKQKTLGDVCDRVEYGSSAKSKKEGKIPVLRMGNIQDGKLDWEKLVYSDDKVEIEKYRLKHNDVLFNRTNSPELVGKTAIYKSEMPAIFAGYLIRIHRKEDLLDADYLNYFLNSEMALRYGKTVTISSVNQANINGAKLKGYPIQVPPISEQRTIVKKLDLLATETQRLASLYQRKIAALDELKKSLLHQAFTGQL